MTAFSPEKEEDAEEELDHPRCKDGGCAMVSCLFLELRHIIIVDFLSKTECTVHKTQLIC